MKGSIFSTIFLSVLFSRAKASPLAVLLIISLLPLLFELIFPGHGICERLRPILIFAILGLGLNIVTGNCGLLNLGVAGFMAIGAYTFGILTVPIFPFQINAWLGLLASLIAGAAAGFVLGLPTLRLRGDYLAVVTLGFGEIIQDVIRNLDTITKGSQGLNPLPALSILGVELNNSHPSLSYFSLLIIIFIIVLLLRNLNKSPVGRAWSAVRDDELAAGNMGVPVMRTKLYAFTSGAALSSLAGALWASALGSTGEPGNFDFQLSVTALCIVIVGGLGNLAGVLLGAAVIVGFNSVFLVELSQFLNSAGLSGTQNVLATPANWKFLVLGLVLILMMRLAPRGLIPALKGSSSK